jgi:adenylyltransferase/sulfurtransferase
MLSEAQIERYSRQIILPQLGGKGQETLLRARVLVNGGALQTTTLLYLAAAGVGTIGLRSRERPAVFSAFAGKVDDDDHQIKKRSSSTLGEPGDPVVATLERLNPDCRVVRHDASGAAAPLIAAYDLVVSEPDPLVDHCGVTGHPLCCSWGQTSHRRLFVCQGGPDVACWACLPAEQKSCTPNHDGAAFERLADLFWGAFQATEALKCVIGLSPSSPSRVFACQFPQLRFSDRPVDKDPDCAVCGQVGED